MAKIDTYRSTLLRRKEELARNLRCPAEENRSGHWWEESDKYPDAPAAVSLQSYSVFWLTKAVLLNQSHLPVTKVR